MCHLRAGDDRSQWLSTLSSWATSGTIPAEVHKCLSVSEMRSRIGSLQPYSAVVVEAGVPGLERDLVQFARDAGLAVFVIDNAKTTTDQWLGLSATAVIEHGFSTAELLNVLSLHASMIGSAAGASPALPVEDLLAWRGNLVVVCGPGGTGTSTVAAALAQGLGQAELDAGLVLLADLARNAEQAMLHDVDDVVPGIEDLVDIHRKRRSASEEIRSHTFTILRRGYQLLLGLRRPSGWATMPPRAIEATIDGLRRSFRTVIADITADFEGESEGGSIDVEERNSLARISARNADVVFVVGRTGMKGTYSLSRIIGSLLSLGVEASRIVTVVNFAPKQGLGRAETSRALAHLVRPTTESDGLSSPVFLVERSIETAWRDGSPLPKQMSDILLAALKATLHRNSRVQLHDVTDEPVRIAPGTLGMSERATG